MQSQRDCNGHSGGWYFPFFTLLWNEWDGAQKALFIASYGVPLGWPVTLKTYRPSKRGEAYESQSSSPEQAHSEEASIPFGGCGNPSALQTGLLPRKNWNALENGICSTEWEVKEPLSMQDKEVGSWWVACCSTSLLLGAFTDIINVLLSLVFLLTCPCGFQITCEFVFSKITTPGLSPFTAVQIVISWSTPNVCYLKKNLNVLSDWQTSRNTFKLFATPGSTHKST